MNDMIRAKLGYLDGILQFIREHSLEPPFNAELIQEKEELEARLAWLSD